MDVFFYSLGDIVERTSEIDSSLVHWSENGARVGLGKRCHDLASWPILLSFQLALLWDEFAMTQSVNEMNQLLLIRHTELF